MALKKAILYFPSPGETNTDQILRAAKIRAEELGITDIVLASTGGNTAVKTLKIFKNCNLVVVSHVTGIKKPGLQSLSDEMKEKIEAGGGKILIAAHAFSGVNRAIQVKFGTAYPTDIIAQVLRMFGQGMKVTVEIVAMAADAGLIPANKRVIAIAGTSRGADTAIVVKPAGSRALFDMVVSEIIAKPL